jgi:hypothetical protein
MNTGMLWYDNDPKVDMTNKIQRAADYYMKKYGQNPDLCFVHPSMLGASTLNAGQIEVRTHRSIRPHHFWIGIHPHV